MGKEESELVQALKDDLKIQIEEAHKATSDHYHLNEINDQEYTREKLFIATSKAVKAWLKDVKQARDYVSKKYKAELRYGAKWYPRVWMLRDKRIAATLEKYPAVVPILNLIDKESRYKKGPSYKDMVETADRVTGASKYEPPSGKGPYSFASFFVDAKFYRRIAEKVGYSEAYIKKFITSFCECGILIKLGKADRHGGMLHADGYYVQGGHRLVKQRFLKNSKEFKEALRTF